MLRVNSYELPDDSYLFLAVKCSIIKILIFNRYPQGLTTANPGGLKRKA